MKLKDAYMAAMKEELAGLVEAKKIALLVSTEETVEELLAALERGLKSGAKLSEDKWDDMVVPPATDFLVSRVQAFVDKIDGQEG